MPDYTRRIAFPGIAPTNNTSVSIGAAHAESGAINSDSVRLCSSVDAFVAFGANPVADNTSTFLPAKTPEVFAFTPGQKISVIQSSGGGTLYVTWGN